MALAGGFTADARPEKAACLQGCLAHPGIRRRQTRWLAGLARWEKFAVVLTHDVEGPLGVAKCRQLMELEKKLGFCSSFNFIPEGDYRVSRELREELTQNGFEVGVHDLNHDGKLYRSRE